MSGQIYLAKMVMNVTHNHDSRKEAELYLWIF
jgi:hypothetical protein